MTGLPYTVRSAPILEALGRLPLTEMRKQQKAIMMYKIIHGTAPKYMIDTFTEQLGPKMYYLRNSKCNVEISAARTSLFKTNFEFVFTGETIWFALQNHLKPSVNAFKKEIKSLTFASATTD